MHTDIADKRNFKKPVGWHEPGLNKLLYNAYHTLKVNKSTKMYTIRYRTLKS